MKVENRYRLRENRTFLESCLEVDEIVDVCLSKCVLERIDWERIRGEPNRPDRALKFVDILMNKENDTAYDRFLDCLNTVGQSFISQQLQTTKVPAECVQKELNREQKLKQVLQDCLEEQKDVDSRADEILTAIRLQLNHQQKWMNVQSAVIFNLIKSLFPEAELQRNERKHVVTIKNCRVKPGALCTGSFDGDALHRISPTQVAAAMKIQLEKEAMDVSFANRFEEEEIDGKALGQLNDNHIEKLFPDLKMGKRICIMGAVKRTIEKLLRPPDMVAKEKRQELKKTLETYRPFDKGLRATGMYKKGYILPEEQSTPASLLEPVHRYHPLQTGGPETLATETIQFAAACMNERVNGTIHFGVMGKHSSEKTSQTGQILGLHVDKDQCDVAIMNEISRAFFDDQKEMAFKCIRYPVYVPVFSQDVPSAQLYVVEVDIVPRSDVVASEAFFLRSTAERCSLLLRHVNGTPTEIVDKDLTEFMHSKKQRTLTRQEIEQKDYCQPMSTLGLHQKLPRSQTV